MAKILDYRQITKLQSTYVIGLQDYILADGKIHTRYVQDLTQTGRLSSVDPNLQNIPIRLEQGRLIRKAFTPSHEDAVLLSSDYSQIELRVLAHISGDEHLIAAFNEGQTFIPQRLCVCLGLTRQQMLLPMTAVMPRLLTLELCMGFLILVCQTTLVSPVNRPSLTLIPILNAILGLKPIWKMWCVRLKTKGYVETLFKRRRELPDINSRNFNVRSFAERTAINSPIQGSAADILKIAMINLDKALQAGGFRAKMLLQVHDEIVLEVPNDELTAIKTCQRHHGSCC